MKIFIALFVVLSLSVQVFGAKSYAILHADYPNYVSDVQAKLAPLIGNVTVISVQYSNPTAAQLAAFDAVLVYSNYGFFDSVALGNLLADYVDHGKGVIVAVFSLTNFFTNSYLGGRFAAPTSYQVISVGVRQYNPDLTLSPTDSSHPILAGVTKFDGGDDSFRSSSTFVGDAHSVALWSDKTTPLIGTRVVNGTRRVDLNFFPPSSDAYPGFWVSSTDGAKILANAFTWVSGSSPSGCNTYTSCTTCATNNCQWCLDSNTCSSPDLTCPDRVTKPGNCPTPTCGGFARCSTCVATGNACSWCLDNSTCVTKNAPCNGEINNPSFCSSFTFN